MSAALNPGGILHVIEDVERKTPSSCEAHRAGFRSLGSVWQVEPASAHLLLSTLHQEIATGKRMVVHRCDCAQSMDSSSALAPRIAPIAAAPMARPRVNEMLVLILGAPLLCRTWQLLCLVRAVRYALDIGRRLLRGAGGVPGEGFSGTAVILVPPHDFGPTPVLPNARIRLGEQRGDFV